MPDLAVCPWRSTDLRPAAIVTPGGHQCAYGFYDNLGGEQVEADHDQPLRGARGIADQAVPVNRQMTMMLASASIPLSRLNQAGRPTP